VALYAFQNNWISEDTFEVKSIVENLPNIELHFEINKENGKPEIYLNKENVESKIRGLEISNLVSKIASIREVRLKLVFEQRKHAPSAPLAEGLRCHVEGGILHHPVYHPSRNVLEAVIPSPRVCNPSRRVCQELLHKLVFCRPRFKLRDRPSVRHNVVAVLGSSAGSVTSSPSAST
jgi:hypothetical protein